MNRRPRQAWGVMSDSQHQRVSSRSKTRKPRQSYRDVESMKEEHAFERKRYSKLRGENVQLKETVERLTNLLQRKELSIHRVLACKLEKSEKFAKNNEKLVGDLKALQLKMLQTSRISDRIRALESRLADKKKDLEATRDMVHNTKLADLKLEMKQNFSKASKLSKILSKLALKLTDAEDTAVNATGVSSPGMSTSPRLPASPRIPKGGEEPLVKNSILERQTSISEAQRAVRPRSARGRHENSNSSNEDIPNSAISQNPNSYQPQPIMTKPEGQLHQDLSSFRVPHSPIKSNADLHIFT